MHIHFFFLFTYRLEDWEEKIIHSINNQIPQNLAVNTYQKTNVDASGKIAHIQYFK